MTARVLDTALETAKARARAAMAKVDEARKAHIDLDLDRPQDEHQAAKHIARCQFECELALRNLMARVDALPGLEAGR